MITVLDFGSLRTNAPARMLCNAVFGAAFEARGRCFYGFIVLVN